MAVYLTMNQYYHANGHNLAVQINPDAGTGTLWINKQHGDHSWHRFEIKLVPVLPYPGLTRWELDPGSSSNGFNPAALISPIESWLVENSDNLCDGKS